MRVLVNVLPVTRGGGLQNVHNLWKAVGEYGRGDDWLFVARTDSVLDTLDDPVPWRDLEKRPVTSFLQRLHLENRQVPELADAWGADLIFTPMGAGPVRSSLPTVVGWHDPSPGYPESPMWERTSLRFRTVERLRRRYARIAVARARRICVQTHTMADRLAGAWALDRDRMRIVSNGLSSFHQGEPPAPEGPPPSPRVVLVIGNAKPNKNLEVVPEVTHALGALDLDDVEVHVTQAADSPWMASFREEEERLGEPSVPLRKIGLVPHDQLGETIRQSAVVFLPSLLESFSQTYLEAMHYGVPLVTSDIDFAREICGDAALYADPLDARACAAQIQRALSDSALRAELRAAGFARVPRFPLWEERFGLYREACREALAETGAAPVPTPAGTPS